jgi:hypothetical protein
VRQGDPCGPLLFALTLQDTLQQTDAAHPNKGVVTVADDTFLHGPTEAVAAACADLVAASMATGLAVQTRKCTVFSPPEARNQQVRTPAEHAASLMDLPAACIFEAGLVATGCPWARRTSCADTSGRPPLHTLPWLQSYWTHQYQPRASSCCCGVPAAETAAQCPRAGWLTLSSAEPSCGAFTKHCWMPCSRSWGLLHGSRCWWGGSRRNRGHGHALRVAEQQVSLPMRLGGLV